MKAILMSADPAQIENVYTEEQLDAIAALVPLQRRIVSDPAEDDFRDVEYIFSTWGMPEIPEEVLALRFPALKVLFYAAGKTDRFVRPFLARGIRVVSAWRANAVPVAEFCTAQILLALKGYFRNVRELNCSASWYDAKRLTGPGIYGEHVALLGAGAIAMEVKRLLENFRIQTLVVPSRAEKRTITLEEAFRTAFVVSSHLPDRTDNKKILTEPLFRSMRQGAVFINTGRGAQVDEQGLIRAMKCRPDLTALLDVTAPEPPDAASELRTLPNIVLSTHIAGSIGDEVHRLSDCVLQEFRRFLSGKQLQHEVTSDILQTS